MLRYRFFSSDIYESYVIDDSTLVNELNPKLDYLTDTVIDDMNRDIDDMKIETNPGPRNIPKTSRH